MFDVTSRYYNLQTTEFVSASGDVTAYKRRRLNETCRPSGNV